MKKNKELKVIDDYYEEDEDNLYNVSMQNDYSNVSYENFSKAKKVEIEDDEEDEYDTKVSVKKSSYSEPSIIYTVLTWFTRIGIVIAVILVAYYITKGMFKDLLFYILLLVLSFGLGFGAMAVIDKAME